MLEPEHIVDLSGELRIAQESFLLWIEKGRVSVESSPCAHVLWQSTVDQLVSDMRGDVSAEDAWQLCCRTLSHPLESKSLGSRDLAQLLLYWFTERQVSPELQRRIYDGMLDDLAHRGRTVQTEDDSHSMRSRWIRLAIHGELARVQQSWLDENPDAVVDFDVDGELVNGQGESFEKEAEEAAAAWKQSVSTAGGVDDGRNRTPAASAEAGSGLAPGELANNGATVHGRDKPLADPPEFGDRINDTAKEPYWIPGAFPTIFQNETGDPYNYRDKEVDLQSWGPHILRSKGWVAQAHMTFMYWWMNTLQRMKALSAKKWYVRDNPQATGYTAEDLAAMSVPILAKQMVGYTQSIPGTRASKARLRKVILAMVRQIEIETRFRGDGEGDLGDVPCLFGTLTSQRYHWDGVARIIAKVEGLPEGTHTGWSKSKRREMVNKYPLFVSWYCAIRLELVLKATVVPIFGASDYIAVFEWSPTGGMVHLHYVLWKRGAPRFDLRAELLEQEAARLRKAGVATAGKQVCHIGDVVDFFGRYVSEWNPNKDAAGQDLKSFAAATVNEVDAHPASLSERDMLLLLEEGASQRRHEYYARAIRAEHMHDFHYPEPLGPPNPSQPCAKLLKGIRVQEVEPLPRSKSGGPVTRTQSGDILGSFCFWERPWRGRTPNDTPCVKDPFEESTTSSTSSAFAFWGG